MDLQKAVLAVTESMFESVGVLQRDAPLSQADTSAYQAQVRQYRDTFHRRISHARELIEAVPVTGHSLEERLAQFKLPGAEDFAKLESRLTSNKEKHEKLVVLFNDLIKTRYPLYSKDDELGHFCLQVQGEFGHEQ